MRSAEGDATLVSSSSSCFLFGGALPGLLAGTAATVASLRPARLPPPAGGGGIGSPGPRVLPIGSVFSLVGGGGRGPGRPGPGPGAGGKRFAGGGGPGGP